MRRRRGPAGRGGFALIAALWLLAAISMVALDLSLRARDHRRSAANVQEASVARGAAEAGVAHARALLERRLLMAARSADAGWADPWRGLDRLIPDSVRLSGSAYRVQLRDAGAALHLNRAGEDELRRLLQALRVDAGAADRIAQAAADWRDADALRRPRGAERAEYLREGASVLPSNQPFRAVAELRHVRGMTDEIFRRVSPYLTIRGSGQVNLSAAPREVLLALPGMTEESVALLLRMQRAGTPLPSPAELGGHLSPGARSLYQRDLPRLMSRATTETREVEIRSSGWVSGGRMRPVQEALAVRAGTAVFLVDRGAP
ncbi:MAG TPA: hypothetical protein VF006_12465 [Longimicrobium sp.]